MENKRFEAGIWVGDKAGDWCVFDNLNKTESGQPTVKVSGLKDYKEAARIADALNRVDEE